MGPGPMLAQQPRTQYDHHDVSKLMAHSNDRVTLTFTRAPMPGITNISLLAVFLKAKFRVCSSKLTPKLFILF